MMATDIVFEAKGLSKRFGPVIACEEIDLQLRAGQLTAIVGDNGAGKSTLLKMLTGELSPDAGTMTLDKQKVRFRNPLAARDCGIETVYQELALPPNLDVVSSVFLGRELTKSVPFLPFARRLDRKQMAQATRRGLEELNVNVPQQSGAAIGTMSGGQRQAIAIARAAHWTSKVLFMDEPTAALGHRESEAVLALVRRVLDRGIAVAMISHILPHVIHLADNVVVLRHGRVVANTTDTLSSDDLIRLILDT